MTRPLTIELFKDIDVDKDASLADIESGIELVNTYANYLEVTRTDRWIDLASCDGDGTNAGINSISSQLSADLNIVMTSAAITDSRRSKRRESSATIGYALPGVGEHKGIAVVQSDHDSLQTQTTTAHEIGHLLNLSYDHSGDSVHCDEEYCIMHSQEASPAAHLFAKSGLWGEDDPRISEWAQTEFCGQCADQLGYRALYYASVLQIVK